MNTASVMISVGHAIGAYINLGECAFRDPGMKHPQEKHIIPFRVLSTTITVSNRPK